MISFLNITSNGKSIIVSFCFESITFNFFLYWFCLLLQKSARSRLQMSLKIFKFSFFIINTYLSWDSLHQSSIGERAGSADGISFRLIIPPRFESFIISGTAFDSPPAPTSWILSIIFFESGYCVQDFLGTTLHFCISALN